jgi:dipeptidyl-peptidase 4
MSVARLRFILLITVVLAVVAGVAMLAQAPPATVTAAEYARAEKFLAATVNPLVVGGTVNANWMPDERFWYRSAAADGVTFLIVSPSSKTRVPAFNHAKLAAALAKAAGATISATALPFQAIQFSADGASVSFDYNRQRWTCDVQGNACASTGEAAAAAPAGGRGGGRGAAGSAATSPDGKRAVFIKDWNLWVRDAASKQETALTKDGEANFGYATDNAGWASSERAVVLWSPDSKKVATYQQDERNVGDMYLVEAKAGHPALKSWKYPLPGDEHVAMLHRVVIDAETGTTVRFQMPPDFHRAMLGDNFSVSDMQWSPDGAQLAFVSTSRDHKQAVVRVADAATGTVRTVFEETEKTHFESRAGWRVLWASGEILWSSQRDDWSQLYLYDLATGKLKNQITTGDGPVTQIVKVDEKSRAVWFTAMGREKGQDPYFRHLYRIGLDGKDFKSLTPDDGDHDAQVSASGKFIVDAFSTCEKPPVVVIRNGDGKLTMVLETADISKLVATGWKPPMPIVVKARDGKTDLYGMLFRPTNFDPSKNYPIINNAYPGPQSGSVGARTFAAARGDKQALAELGFVVVSIDGMGTPGRSKTFHDAYYGAMGRDNTLPDQVAGMKELAQKYPWIDIDRAAIWGHSGGGFIAADAMFRYPDFFKVGISESGNHDQRVYEDDWGERYQGLLVKDADGKDSYEAEANQTMAKNLKGKLMLAHGLMDNNVPPYNTTLVVDALIKANKDFDLVLFPFQAHGYGTDANYMMRRRWDYFVRWLLNAEPPKDFSFQPPAPPGGRGGRGGGPVVR